MTNKKNDIWFYNHQTKNTKRGPFSMEALCSFIIDEKIELKDVLLCQEGWPKWVHCESMPIFVEEFQKAIKSRIYTLPSIDQIEDEDEIPPILPEMISSVNKVENKVENKEEKGSERRKHQRYDIALKVVFISGKKSFRTKTSDLSLGGLKIVDKLPKCYFDRKIEVFLSSPDLKVSIKFEAELIANKSTSTHVKFSCKDDIRLKQLENWLQSVSRIQLKKTA
jgi:hypothetical protein